MPRGRRRSGPATTLAALALVLAPIAARAETESDSAAASPTPSFFDVNKYRADPDNPGVIRVPGTNVALYIGGFAQLDVISDFNVIGNPDQFVVSSIPVGGGTGNTGSQLTARQSRVFIETDAPWTVAPLMAYVELDFFDPQNQSDFHIRHAFGAIGRPGGVRLLGGQTYSSFMDATVIPSQLDYAGPVGLANVLQSQARLIVPVGSAQGPTGQGAALEWLLAIEAPNPQITIPMGETATGFSYWPDVVTTLRWNHGHGHVLVSGRIPPARHPPRHRQPYRRPRLWRQLHRPPDGLLGQGPVPLGRGRRPRRRALLRGIERASTSTPSCSRTACWRRPASSARWGRTSIISGATGSPSPPSTACCASSTSGAGTDTTLKQSQYVGGVLQYFPNKRFMVGAEYLFGQRENRNEQTGADNRLQVSTQVKF